MSVVFNRWLWAHQEEIRRTFPQELWLYVESLAQQAWDYAIENAAIEAQYQLYKSEINEQVGLDVAAEIRAWKTSEYDSGELRNCIFCGKQPDVFQDELAGWFVNCQTVECPGYVYCGAGPGETREEAIVDWQKQVI